MHKRIIVERRHGPPPEQPPADGVTPKPQAKAEARKGQGAVERKTSRVPFQPFAVVALGEVSYLVDGEGAALKRVADTEAVDLPVIRGLDPEAVEDDPQGARVVLGRGLAILDEVARAELRVRVTEIHLRRKGDVIVLKSGLRAHLPTEDPASAIVRLARTMAHLTARKQKAVEIRLNAKDPGQVTVRLAGESGGGQ